MTTRLLVVTGVRLYSDGLKLLLEAKQEHAISCLALTQGLTIAPVGS